MEKFIVSARKYRPQNFNSVVGQEHITTTLKNAIKNDQLAHAFLFCGPRGVGKTTCARILGKTINCQNRTESGEACSECASCVSFDRGTSLNIHELDAASNNSVDDIRALVDQVRFAPQAGKYKVYIVDEVHMLSAAAFNAFLKTLEEPPPYAIFILATTEKHKILPTILSRCQIFDFRRINNADTIAHLRDISQKENISADDAALHIIAQKSEGCLRDSLSLFDKIVSFTDGEVTYENTLTHLNILDEDYYFRLRDMMGRQQASEVLVTFDEINRKGFEPDIFLNGFAEFLRNLLISKDDRSASLLEVAEGFKDRYKQTASGVSASWIISAVNIVNDAELSIRQARNKRLHTELMLIKLCYLDQALDLSQGLPVKKKHPDEIKSISFRALTPKYAGAYNEEENISTGKPAEGPAGNEAPQPQAEAKLTIEPGMPAKKKPAARKPKAGRLKSLAEVHESIAQEHLKSTTKELTEDELYLAWDGFIQQLEQENQLSAVASFKNSELQILAQNAIEIVCSSEFHKHFIEATRSALVSHLQAWFNNRTLTYTVRVEQKQQEEEKEEYLNSRQKFLRIAQEYPAVKELKEKLGLRIEF